MNIPARACAGGLGGGGAGRRFTHMSVTRSKLLVSSCRSICMVGRRRSLGLSLKDVGLASGGGGSRDASSAAPLLLRQYGLRSAAVSSLRGVSSMRGLASLSTSPLSDVDIPLPPPPTVAGASGATGAIQQYEQWVAMGKLKEDEHQRGIVTALQDLQDELKNYQPPKVVHPVFGAALRPQKTSMLDALLRRSPPPPPKTQLPEYVPKGLYLHGDVGSGKTMLMDMFYYTLPPNITSKTRIHFLHFMQDVHKRLHTLKMKHGSDFDAMPFVGAEMAESGSVLCFDEFQCTDVADAMILRRLLESLMSHGVVLVCTSNRHPNDLYKNGLQRDSFLPCIALLNNRLRVINLDSTTDYRKLPRPSSSVYHYPLNPQATAHAQKWFKYLSSPQDPPHPATHSIWGRQINVPLASGKCAMFSFSDLCEKPLGAADYLELTRLYEAFIVTDVPTMDYRTRDYARRFITFIDAIYERRGKLVLTLATSPGDLFLDDQHQTRKATDVENVGEGLDAHMRSLMDDLGMNMKMLKNSSIFTGDEERFAFARALSRLSEMESVEWVGRKD